MENIALSFSEATPGLELSNLLSILAGVGLASLRIGSFFLASPLFGYRVIPLQFHLLLVFLYLVIFLFQTLLN